MNRSRKLSEDLPLNSNSIFFENRSRSLILTDKVDRHEVHGYTDIGAA